MKNILTFIFLFVLIVFQPACERDDICLEDTTPKLILRFYNNQNPTQLRSVSNLKVNILGTDGEYVNGTISSLTDSIAIPLRVEENSTRIVLTLTGDEVAGTEDNPDTIALIYSQEDIFVSRSCGFKTIYKDTEISLTADGDNWIKAVETKTDPFQITDESTAHVKMYH